MTEKINNMMKDKYNVTRSSPLKITSSDNLYTAYRKLADNIYKNGDWTDADFEEGAKNILDFDLFTRKEFEPKIEKLTLDKESELFINRVGQSVKGGSVFDRAYKTTYHNGNEIKESYLFVDSTNKSNTSHRNAYVTRKGAIENPFNNGSKESFPFTVASEGRLIGYSKLHNDIFKELEKNPDVDFDALDHVLLDLERSSYASKKYANYRFEKSFIGSLTREELALLPTDTTWNDEISYVLKNGNGRHLFSESLYEREHKRNIAIEFVSNYIENTYNIILEQEYEKDITKLTRANAFTTKKNINKETQDLMNITSLNSNFKFVEIDNDVDVDMFQQFETEMAKISPLLPKTETGVIPTLRLRKLGNYHALGLFDSSSNTIAVDFRNLSADELKEGKNLGIRSFVHEYGHFLDFNSNADLGDANLISLTPEFKEIIKGYSKNANDLPSNSYVQKKLSYYVTPTEIFARGFELYVSDLGLDSSFNQSPDIYNSLPEYTCFDEKTRTLSKQIYDKYFPELKEKIELYNKGELESVDNTLNFSIEDYPEIKNVKESIQSNLENKFKFELTDSDSKIKSEILDTMIEEDNLLNGTVKLEKLTDDEYILSPKNEGYKINTDAEFVETIKNQIELTSAETTLATLSEINSDLVTDYKKIERTLDLKVKQNLQEESRANTDLQPSNEPSQAMNDESNGIGQSSPKDALNTAKNEDSEQLDNSIEETNYKVENIVPETPKSDDTIINNAKNNRLELISNARSKSIVEVAESLNMDLKRVGSNAYAWKEHDSFMITPSKNLWNWFSEDVGGDVISLVQTIKNVSFNDAIDFLNNGDFNALTESEEEQISEPFKYYLENYESKDLSKVKEFLNVERGLSEQTINKFIENGDIAQANHKSKDIVEPIVVFKFRDKHNDISGASLQGIENHPDIHDRQKLKRIMKGSDGFNGFTFDIGKPERLVFCESPIDLMSYYELHENRLNNVRLVAMDGLKESTISRKFVELQEELQNKDSGQTLKAKTKQLSVLAKVSNYFDKEENQNLITLAIDNDDAGLKFIDKLNEKGIKFKTEIPPRKILEDKMDWNDFLKNIKKEVLNTEKFQKEKDSLSEEKTIDADKKLEKDESLESNLEDISREEPTKENQNDLSMATSTPEKDKIINNNLTEIFEKKDAKLVANFLKEDIKKYLEIENYKKFLNGFAKLGSYSSNNIQLLLAQNEDVSMVASYQTWKKEFGFNVKKGAKSFKVWKPYKYPLKDSEGNILKDDKGKEIWKTKFNLAPVFDISQTDGKKETLTLNQNFNVKNREDAENFYRAIVLSVKNENITFSHEDINSDTKSYFKKETIDDVDKYKIIYQTGMSPTETFSEIFKELALIEISKSEVELSDSLKNFRSESVSYAIMQHFSLDTNGNFQELDSIKTEKNPVAILTNELKFVKEINTDLTTKIENQLDKMSEKTYTHDKFKDKLNKYKEESLSKSKGESRTENKAREHQGQRQRSMDSQN